MAVLEVDNLHVFYGNIHALRGLSLAVEKDEIVTLIGANGAGKTPTLNANCSILAPAEGEVRFEGEVLTYVAPHDVVGRGIVQVPEGRRIFGRLTVGENLRMGAFLRTDKQEVRQSEEHVLAMFPVLRERIRQVAGTLSGGEQQMLAMARGLMSKPRVLLLDEPSMGLAPMLVETIFEAVLAIRKEGVPVLLVEQNAFMALQIADRGYVMETGEIVLQAPAGSCWKTTRSSGRISAEPGSRASYHFPRDSFLVLGNGGPQCGMPAYRPWFETPRGVSYFRLT